MHIFTKTVKQIFLPCLMVGFASFNLQAQQTDSVSAPADSASSRVEIKGARVTGTIKDASTGKPLDGISISVPGYSASITDANGHFRVGVPNPNAVLIISGDGFHKKEIALKGRSSIETSLFEDTYTSVYDVVNLPGGPKLNNQTTGSLKSLNISDNWQRISEAPDTYLQGRVAGVNAIRRSGTPGIGASVFLRGYNSLYTTSQPLYVIDGLYYDSNDYGSSLIAGHIENPLANIDLKDIDNITVIKDATASVYGTRAANGVVLVTTARAKDQATRIDFAAYGGYNFKPSSIPVMNASQYRTYLSDALGGYLTGLGFNALQTSTVIQNQPYMNDDPANTQYFRYHNETDWQDKVFRDSYNQNYYLKVTGGDNIATYGLSLGFLKNNGTVSSTDLTRYQTRFNADLNLSNKLKGNANLSFVSNEQNIRDQGTASSTSPIFLALTKAPFLSANDVSETGELSPNFAGVDIFNKSNPAVAASDKVLGLNRNYRFMGSVGFSYEFSKKLSLQTLVGATFSKVRENSFLPEKGIVVDTIAQAIVRNRSGANVERLFSLFNDTRLKYAKTFNNVHDFAANIGFRFNDSKSESDYGLGYNAATDEYISVGNGQASLRKVSGQNGKWRSLNLYAGADYSFMRKYFLSFNIGLDGSSRFGKDAPHALSINGNKIAVMPSVAGAWLISSEKFMADNEFIDVLKLRSSYGLVGNEDLGNTTARQYYVSQNFLGVQGLVRGNIANTTLKWETVGKFNIGLDGGFLGERLNLSFDYFRNHTYDMVVQEPTSSVTGFDYAFSNNGGMTTNGVELGINGRLLNKSVKWDMGLNIATFKNKITSIPGDRLITNYAGATVLTQKGMEALQFYGHVSNGVYSSDAEAAASGLANRREDGTIIALKGGDVRFVDANGDKFIDDNDRQVIGKANADFTGGLSNTVSWKRLSLDALITFSKGNDIYNYLRRNLESENGFQNQTPNILNRWRADGQVTDVPKAVIGDPAANSRFSDRWIEDGSYLRLRTVSLTYNVPMKGKSLKYAKIYVTGNNLLTLTKYLGYDPEFSATGSIFTQGIDAGFEPQYKTIQMGVRVGL